ncbi:MAG: magnesium transporter CorA family protein [Halanaerobium sp.]|nr:magnesium transporter CorA family protein [Halanaerobium sp.]
MLEMFKTAEDGRITRTEDFGRYTWVNLIDPSEEEINRVIDATGIEREFLLHSLDPEERPRIDQEENQTLIIIDIPTDIPDEYPEYTTLPLGIILMDKLIITVSKKQTKILDDFKDNRVKNHFTSKRTRFLFQIFYQVARAYLNYLRKVNKKSEEIEQRLHLSLKNEELYALLNLEKSLVYFTTSIKANEAVMEKIMKYEPLEFYEEDEEIMEDAIIENKQAMEMASIYSNILSGMMDAFASVISNNLNIVMKLLAAITIILSIPTMIASFYGMNVLLPMQENPHAFIFIMGFSLIVAVLVALILNRKNML